MTSEEIQPQQYPYSVKIEQSPYGARVSVHSYASTEEEVIVSAIALYSKTREYLQTAGFKIAPEEPAAKKEANKDK